MPVQKTLSRGFELSGVGVHSGKPVHLAVLPRAEGGLVFRRTDLDGLEIPLAGGRLEARHSTAIVAEKFRVTTIEHLLAALFAFGVRHAVIALDADEVPILDGSALPFVRAIEAAGTRALIAPAAGLRIVRPFAVEEDGASIVVEPPSAEDTLDLSYGIEYAHPAIGMQALSMTFDPEAFARDVAPARTFGFLHDVETLRARGLAFGASYENTVVLDADRVVSGPLRFPDEFVRHKLLDLTGDLALLGRPLAGRFTAHKAGHRLHLEVVRFLLAHPEYTTTF
jgi:UDP-3-O-[3-hydroxymyristoyl] N-acetylglucosamine deacetylase